MKRNAIIALALGVVILCAAAYAAINMLAPEPISPADRPANETAATPTPRPLPTKAEPLEKFALLKDKIAGAGLSYGGGAVQLIAGEETALVFIYKPPGSSDVTDLLATGFSSVYEVFDTKEPLLVGIVDTTQYISPQQFKIDLYALERPIVAEFINGNMTRTELAARALLVTPETESLHPDGSNVTVKQSVDLAPEKNRTFSEPASRNQFFVETLNQSGYLRPISLEAGPLGDGQDGVNVVMALKRNATAEDNYREIEALLGACAGSYGDYDRYMITLIPPAEGFNDYYVVDASSEPVLDYYDGLINQYQLYNSLNLTYYTK